MKTQLQVRGFEPNAELYKYLRHKLAEINRRLPRSIRTRVACVVTLSQRHRKAGDMKTCAVRLTLPHGRLEARETTQHMYAALDIVVEQITVELRGYKSVHHRRGLRPRPAEGGSEWPVN